MKKFLLLLAWVVSPFLCAYAFQSNPIPNNTTNPVETILLEGDQSRNLIFLGDEELDVELCNLKVGETYHVMSVMPGPCSPELEGEGKGGWTTSSAITFQATDICQSFTVHPDLSGLDCGTDAYISISCQSCESTSIAEGFGPITGTIVGSPNPLVEDVFIGGGCFEVSNVSYSGSVVARGTFAGGMTSIGLSEGIVLSSGNIADITGPNNVTNSGAAIGGGGDPDLQLIGGSMNDAAVLEFDFQPTLPQISFRYVFASEEYCDFANSAFNDAFGFFLSGPGINGIFSNNAVNVAQLPGGAGQVSINNVNHLSNPLYYQGNIPAGDPQLGSGNCAGHPINGTISVQHCEFDGYTVVLTAVANVIPCETYHIKLAVADAVDAIYDSAVFLEANSFDAGGSAEVTSNVPITQSTTAYEGCGVGFFNFVRTSGDLSQPYVINYTVGGTATPGLDYSPLPTSVVIPPGQTSISIPVTAFSDLIAEGTETITLVLDEPCSCDAFTAELLIEDLEPIDIQMDDIEACAGLPLQIFPTVSGGVNPLFYQWSNGSGAPFYIDVVTGPETISLTVTDLCGQVSTETIDVDVFELEAEISGSVSLCGGGTGELQVDFNGEGPWTINYTIDGGDPIAISGITDNPFFLPVTEQGVYEIVFLVNSGGCQGTATGTGVVTGSELSLAANLTNSSCEGGDDGVIDLVVGGGGPPYTFDWSNGSTQEDPNNLPAGTYSVTVTDGSGCTGEETFEITEPVGLNISVDEIVGVDCSDPTGGAISISVGGGSPGYSYNWSNGTNIEDATNLSAGTYTIIVTDANGCTQDSSITVAGDTSIPIADVQVSEELTCEQTEVTLDGSGSTAGASIVYEWVTLSGGAITGSTTGNTTTVDGGGTYELTVTDQDNGCFSTASVIVVPNTTQPIANAGPEQTLTCSINTLNLQGSGTGPNLSYEWMTPDGNIVSGGGLPNPTVNSTGTYTLIVTNGNNGCSDTSTVMVVEDVALPTVDPGPDATVDCSMTTTILDGSGSSAGPEYSYQWTTTTGDILTDPTSLNPEVEGAGIYLLEITNTNNGCISIDSLEVFDIGNEPTIDIAPPAVVNCDNLEIVLDATGSFGAGNLTFSWTVSSGGGIVSGGDSPSPTIDGAGTYELEITDDSNGCSSTLEIDVLEDFSSPMANAGPSFTLDCTQTNITLDGSNSSSGANIIYEWTAVIGGNIVSGGNTTNPVIDEPGTYQLFVTNTDNGCSSAATVVVDGDSDTPIAQVLVPGNINCNSPEVTINGSGSSIGGNFTYNWSTVDGNILTGATTLFPVINAAGTYTLEVLNASNGCTSLETVTIGIDTLAPIADPGAPATLNCLINSVNLDGSNSSAGPGFVYSWTTPDGMIVGDTTVANPEVNAPGTYLLTVVNENNGCVSTQSVVVDEDTSPPLAEAGGDDELNCAVTDLTLDGSGSAVGPTIEYTWSTTDGNIVGGGNTINPMIDQAGTYEITVLNTENGCEATDLVEVTQDVIVPIADAGMAFTLNCILTEEILDGSSSSSGPNISYNWSAAGMGNILSGGNTSTPLINGPGTYTLIVTNEDNFCADTALVAIDQDIAEPIADAGTAFELNCLILDGVLDGSASSQGGNFAYTWTTGLDGNIVSGGTTTSPTVDAPGTYDLLVTNIDNGCTATAAVTITEDVDEPIADPGQEATLNCAETSLVLDGSGSSSGANFSYLWDSGTGNILSGANTINPEIDEPGTYILTVVNADNGCESSAAVEILEDVDVPIADAGLSDELNCYNPTLILDGTGSSDGMPITYSWTTTDGVIDAGNSTETPQISGPGTYQITVFNTENFCVDSASVTITQDIDPPVADAGPSFELDCTTSQTNLDGSLSSSGPIYTYEWTTGTGTILSGENTTAPIIGGSGTYDLLVTNTNNGCTNTASVEVTEDLDAPEANVALAPDLTCATNSIVLDGNGSSQGANIVVSWEVVGPTGNIVNGANGYNPEVDEPGTYQITIVDLDNNCEAVATVEVNEDVTEPTVVAEAMNPIDCDNNTVSISGMGTSTGMDFTYSWSTMNGNILSGGTTLNPTVDQSGDYELLVTNLSNGCTSTATATVTVDTVAPIAAILPPDLLTCVVEEVALNGTGSSTGANISYTWSTNGGVISGGLNDLLSEAIAPGDYTLEVLNTDNGCSAEAQIVVDQDTELPIVEAGQNGLLTCAVTSLDLDGSGSQQGANITYQWSALGAGVIAGGGTSLNPTITAPGLYELLVTNVDNGCTSTDEVTVAEDVAEPVISLADPADLTCVTEEVTINAGGSSVGAEFMYSWATANGGNIIDATNPNAVIANAVGEYTLTILNEDNGCESAVTVSVAEDVTPPGAEAGDNLNLNCNLESLELTASPNAGVTNVSYEWSTSTGVIDFGANTANPSISATGEYLVVITNNINGCTSEDLVQVLTNDPTDFDFDVTPPVCNTNSGLISFGTVIGGESPYLYSIDGGATFSSLNTFSSLQPGSYNLQIQDANGCELFDDTVIPAGTEVSIDLEPQVIIDLGDTYQLNALVNVPESDIESVTWSPTTGLSCTDCLYPEVSPLNEISYTVTVRTTEGCEANARIALLVRKIAEVYVPSGFSPNNDGVNDEFMIFAGDQVAKVNAMLVFNRWGEPVFQYYNFQPNDPTFSWDGRHRGQFVNPGVFTWMAEIEFIDGRTEVFKGDVTLIR